MIINKEMIGYVVVCLDDDGEEVRATRRIFDSSRDANGYASTVARDRKARVITTIDYLITVEGWRRV